MVDSCSETRRWAKMQVKLRYRAALLDIGTEGQREREERRGKQRMRARRSVKGQ